MAQKFGPDKRSGNIGRTTIDPQIGGKAGDAGPNFQKEGAQPRTKITDSRISDSPDAGFSGKATPLSGFGKAFSIAYAKGPGTIFTYKGKKYKAIKKHAGKGPPKNRKEDKVTKGTMLKGRPEGKNPPKKTYTVDGKKVVALSRKDAIDKVKSKKTTPASGRFGQRKAGGIMKARFGKLALDLIAKKPKQNLGNYTKREVAELTKMDPKKQAEFMKMLDEMKAAKMVKAPKISKKKVATVGAIGAGVTLIGKQKKTKKPKRKEDKVSQADIIGKGSKTGRRAGGMMKAKNGGFPDLSGDGKVTQKDILIGRKVIKKRGGGAAIRGMNFKGNF